MISQRTVARLQSLLEFLFIEHRRYPQLWSWQALRTELYANDVDNNWLEYISQEYFGNPRRFLPSILDGTIPAYVTRNNGWGQPAPNDDDRVLGQVLIIKIIEVIAEYAPHIGQFAEPHQLMDNVTASLKFDGYELVGGKVTPTAIPGVDLQPEGDYLLAQIRSIGPGNLADVQHHYNEAVETFVNGNWGASSTENRNFLISLLRGLRELATTKGGIPAYNQLGKDGPLIHDFHAIGMLTDHERDAVLHVWVLLSHAGPHVGIKEEESALLGRILVLGMTRWVCLKFEAWAANGFKRL